MLFTAVFRDELIGFPHGVCFLLNTYCESACTLIGMAIGIANFCVFSSPAFAIIYTCVKKR